jgi:hypothetical protein
MANVLFRRGTQEYINNNVPISDGQVVFNETDQAIYVDTPVNNVITRLRYGGGNLSRSDIDSALSDTSENPVQNKVITESVLQKTDIVNDYNTAVAVTATDIPVGCGVIKTANTKIGDLQTALNTTNGTVAQHTSDIASLNTGLATKIGTHTDSGTHGIKEIAYNTSTGIVVGQDAVTDEWYSLSDNLHFYSNVITPLVSGFTMTFNGLYVAGRLCILLAHIQLTQNYASETVVAKINTTAPIALAECTCRDNQGHFATFRLDTDKNIKVWGQAQATNDGIYLCQFTYFA